MNTASQFGNMMNQNIPQEAPGLELGGQVASMEQAINPYRSEDLMAGPEPMTIQEYLAITEVPDDTEMKNVVKLHNDWSDYVAKRHKNDAAKGGQ